jgi:hypothetical protein
LFTLKQWFKLVNMVIKFNTKSTDFQPLLRKLRISSSQDSIVPRHPVGQDEVDARAFDGSSAPTEKQERTALPKKVRAHTLRDRNDGASAIVRRGTGGKVPVGLPQINESIIVRALEPVVQQTNRFLITNWIRTIHGPVDHVEMGIPVVTHRIAQDAVGVAVVPQRTGTSLLKANEVIQIDRRQIELKVRTMRIECL